METRLSEDEVRQILERAISLESGGLTVKELRDAASEAGIDENALAAALAETLAARSPGSEDFHRTSTIGSKPFLQRLVRPAIIGIASYTAGVMVYAAGSPGEYGDQSLNLLCTAVMCVASLLFARTHQADGNHEDFQAEVAALWFPYLTGWSIMHGGVWDDMAFGITLFWLSSAIIGGLIVHIGRLTRKTSEDR